MGFARHGRYSVELEDDLILIEAAGPFNDETVSDFAEEFKACVGGLGGRPYYQLVTFTGEASFVPDALSTLAEHVRWEAAHGAVSVAFCGNEDAAKFLMEAQMSEAFRDSGIPIEFFDDEEGAMAWIAKLRAERDR